MQQLEGNVIVLNDLFRFKPQGFDDNGKCIGTYEATGLQPQFLSKFKARGVEIPKNLFETPVDSMAWDGD